MLADNISARTIALWILISHSAFGFFPCLRIYTSKTNVPVIYNLPELSIRIFNPITSFFLIKRYEYRIKNPDIQCCRIKYPTEH